MRELLRDIRYGLRVLRKQPGFTAIAVAMLAIGIGSCAAMISFADAVLFRAAPYPKADELVSVSLIDPRGRGRTLQRDTVRLLREGSPLAAFAGEEWAFRALSGAGEPESLQGSSVTAGSLDLFGVSVAYGRGFSAEDYEPGVEPVVILSHKLFSRRFGGDRGRIGDSVQLDGTPHMLIGVLPPGIYFPRGGEMAFLVPGRLDGDGPRNLQVFGRLQPGASIEQTTADLQRLVQNFHGEHGDERAEWRIGLIPVKEKLLAQWRVKLTM
ncbi:MAG: hypothetical protein GY953_34320, partial [bacterium]|nr:hypothetical protein [bacterium]